MAEPQSPHRDTRTAATLLTAFKLSQRSLALKIRTAIPAKVLSYDNTTQQATIELGTKARPYTQEGTEEAPPFVLNGVPVLWPRTSLGYLTLPVTPGDTGLALVCDRSLSDWRIDGEAHAPTMTWTHNPGDCVFVPGLFPDVDPISPPPTANAAQLEASLIKLGMNASQAAVLGDAFLTLYNAFTAAFRAHTHIAPPTGGVTDPPSTAGAVTDMTSAHLSAKVKVDS